MQKNTKVKAFTLIELLVVVAIIGILASLVMVSLQSGYIKTRDAKRTSNIKAIQTALELYYADNGNYPQLTTSVNYPNISVVNVISASNTQWDELGTLLRPYIDLPLPPSTFCVGMGCVSYPYFYQSSGTKSICLPYNSGANYIVITKGYYIGAGFQDPNNKLPLQDEGTQPFFYEIIGGDYQRISAPPPNNCG